LVSSGSRPMPGGGIEATVTIRHEIVIG
jgi:hypothetical protein